MTNNPSQLPFDPISEARRQWEAHDWPEPEAMAAITSIMRVQQILITQIERVLRPFELTFARYEALVLLYFSRAGALPLGKIGARLQVHPTSVTNIIDRLENQGLVRRVPHEHDGRTTLAEITTKGRRLVTQATEVVTRDAFASLPLSGDETDQLFDILRSLRRRSGDFTDADLIDADVPATAGEVVA